MEGNILNQPENGRLGKFHFAINPLIYESGELVKNLNDFNLLC